MHREWAILLDLDNTLVITDLLLPLREKRHWSSVYASFGKTELPLETRSAITTLGQWATVGVVTNSPRVYAERLLRFHALHIPVLVAYHDTPRRKPAPDPILIAAERLRVPPNFCIHIGDSPSDHIAAVAAGTHSIIVDWTATGDPNCLRTWGEVLMRIQQILSAAG